MSTCEHGASDTGQCIFCLKEGVEWLMEALKRSDAQSTTALGLVKDATTALGLVKDAQTRAEADRRGLIDRNKQLEMRNLELADRLKGLANERQHLIAGNAALLKTKGELEEKLKKTVNGCYECTRLSQELIGERAEVQRVAAQRDKLEGWAPTAQRRMRERAVKVIEDARRHHTIDHTIESLIDRALEAVSAKVRALELE